MTSMSRRSRAFLLGSENGNALIEMAIALPVLLMVVTGIYAFAIVFYNYQTLSQAVGVGGQYLSQIRTSTSDPCLDTFNAITGAGPTLTQANIGLTLTMNGTSVTAKTCPSYVSYLTQGGSVTVQATYPCQYPIYNFVWSSCQLKAAVTEYEY